VVITGGSYGLSMESQEHMDDHICLRRHGVMHFRLFIISNGPNAGQLGNLLNN
jgi:hypothetical protein